MNIFRRKKRYQDYDINPDEIFIDTMNVSELDQQQFEGVIEKRIPTRSLVFLGIFIGLASLGFVIQLVRLQLIKGAEYAERAESNRFNQEPIFAERGIIYDKNLVELAWNENDETLPFLTRAYIAQAGYGHLLGYVNYPKADDKGNYWRTAIEGQAGFEKQYNDFLSGANGAFLEEVNALGETVSETRLKGAQGGKNLVTTIDSRIQTPLYEAIKQESQKAGFVGGAAVMLDVETGAVVSMTSYPEFDPYTLAQGTDTQAISGFFASSAKPFLNRAVSGLYSPGSTIKPFLALAALHEGLITSSTKIVSTGRIEVPNPYNPKNTSYFRDWRPKGHGVTDVYHAIADSVNTFFYAIGGGYRDQKGLGITKIDSYLSEFGFGKITGVNYGTESEGTIPNPEWKEENFADGTWRLGDTYNTSIGQFGFQVSVIQLAQSFATLANGGRIYVPYLVEGEQKKPKNTKTIIQAKNYLIIRDAMRDTVTEGTAKLLNVPYVEIAAKTGTAQVGVNNEFKNSWAVGFYPYDKPKYAFALVMERAPNTTSNTGSAARAFRAFLDGLYEKNPEFWTELEEESPKQ